MTTSWAVTLTFPGSPSESALDELEDNLPSDDYFVAALPMLERFAVTGTIMCPDWQKASDVVAHTVGNVIGALEPISVETVDLDEYDRRANAATLPDVVSSTEVAEMLGVTRQRVLQLANDPRFPEPLFRLATGSIWSVDAIRAFEAKWERKPGRRPAKVPA